MSAAIERGVDDPSKRKCPQRRRGRSAPRSSSRLNADGTLVGTFVQQYLCKNNLLQEPLNAGEFALCPRSVDFGRRTCEFECMPRRHDTTNATVDGFRHLDYRAYLTAWYASKGGRLSYRAFARRAGLGAPN